MHQMFPWWYHKLIKLWIWLICIVVNLVAHRWIFHFLLILSVFHLRGHLWNCSCVISFGKLVNIKLLAALPYYIIVFYIDTIFFNLLFLILLIKIKIIKVHLSPIKMPISWSFMRQILKVALIIIHQDFVQLLNKVIWLLHAVIIGCMVLKDSCLWYLTRLGSYKHAARRSVCAQSIDMDYRIISNIWLSLHSLNRWNISESNVTKHVESFTMNRIEVLYQLRNVNVCDLRHRINLWILNVWRLIVSTSYWFIVFLKAK